MPEGSYLVLEEQTETHHDLVQETFSLLIALCDLDQIELDQFYVLDYPRCFM